MMTLVATGAPTLSTAMPTASVRAVALLASHCTEASTFVALLVSTVLIVASTRTLAAVMASEMASEATPTADARPSLKPFWSNASTVPATVTASSITG